MKRWIAILFAFVLFVDNGNCQDTSETRVRIMFQGLVFDAATSDPLSNTQIIINRSFNTSSGPDGTFAFYVFRNDTVTFMRLGYKDSRMLIADTLKGSEFIAGVYMQTDTLSLDEVIIMPRLANLKSDLLKPRIEADREFENAKYNMALSAYQGRVSSDKLGDPAINYELLRQRQRYDAYTRGQIPGDKMIGISPLLLIPAFYLLMNGLPEKPASFQPVITEQEINQIHRKYLETIRKR
jgi:hypothetical protein